MSRTTYFVAATLDGFIADRQHSLDWLFDQHDADLDSRFDYDVFIRDVGAVVMGRTTYEWILTHHVDADAGATWPYPMPAWVFAHREPPGVAGADVGADVRFVSGDVATRHDEIVASAAGRDVWIVGGGDLAGQYADAGLLDEVIVNLAPVTLGDGAPLLPRRLGLRLEECVANGDFVAARYSVAPAGPTLEA